jgi:phosphatidylserine/phosphatidylglycerophosphate/cardiolipin synthase-like enzyme
MADGDLDSSWLEPGRTCWRRATTPRAAFLMDNSTYFAAALGAIRKAKRSILLLGWGFDPRTRMWPDEECAEGSPDEIGAVLKRMALREPKLDVRLLIWKSALPVSISQDFFPHRSKAWFTRSPVRFLLDATVPFGACHHQKVLVIDDRIAFCGGGDISVDRWDSPAHLDRDPRRRMPSGKEHVPRHEVMLMVEGEAASAFGDLARERWRSATGAAVPPPVLDADDDGDRWPAVIQPDTGEIEIGISRTLPRWRNQAEVREIEALHIDAIRKAKRTIYLENQYFTAPIIAEALARRLAEPEGPEVVLVSTHQAPSWFDHATMDRTRSSALDRLKAADLHGRFRAFCPVTREGRTIIVHSKVAIIDDDFMRVGSANLNNRSAGFDTECDASFHARSEADVAAVARFRARLLGHFTSFSPSQIEETTREKGLVAALDEAVASADRTHLIPIPREETDPVTAFVAAYHIGDPLDPLDAWRPFLRKRRLEKRLLRLERREG